MPYTTIEGNRNQTITFKFIGMHENEGFQNEEER